MEAALARHVRVDSVTGAPYLYRYLVRVLADHPDAAAFVDAVQRDEVAAAQRGDIVFLGRRMVGSLRV